MKALIHLTCPVKIPSAWVSNGEGGYTLTFVEAENSARITDVVENQFDVCLDELIWVDCESDVTTNKHYYNKSTSTIVEITEPTYPS
jgi:hypothetical protein